MIVIIVLNFLIIYAAQFSLYQECYYITLYHIAQIFPEGVARECAWWIRLEEPAAEAKKAESASCTGLLTPSPP